MNASSLLRFPAWLCLGAIACAEAADVPDVPNLNALQREYDDPSAGLDPEEASALIERFPELEQLAAALRAADPVLVRIDDARGAADERTGSAVELQGALTLDLSCPGADRTPRFDPATNGSLSLQLAVERSEIRQAFWGEARRCVLRGA
ncbi:MAG TPA: hypothetical protein VNN80_26145, partial [Polyangiaceae bacterium]|nr:hypothetical protein [Polyangiaceae bacterium]